MFTAIFVPAKKPPKKLFSYLRYINPDGPITEKQLIAIAGVKVEMNFL